MIIARQSYHRKVITGELRSRSLGHIDLSRLDFARAKQEAKIAYCDLPSAGLRQIVSWVRDGYLGNNWKFEYPFGSHADDWF